MFVNNKQSFENLQNLPFHNHTMNILPYIKYNFRNFDFSMTLLFSASQPQIPLPL